MRILKNKRFAKQAKSLSLTDEAVIRAIDEIRKGSIDARLGGNLIKKRVAIGEKGKSGGLRTILVYRASAEKLFCIYAFGKNEQENITTQQLAELKLLAKALLELTEESINKALAAGELIEVVQYDVDENDQKTSNEENGKASDETSVKRNRKKNNK